jgi:hypothetical protein
MNVRTPQLPYKFAKNDKIACKRRVQPITATHNEVFGLEITSSRDCLVAGSRKLTR